jgi:hypothetical protein
MLRLPASAVASHSAFHAETQRQGGRERACVSRPRHHPVFSAGCADNLDNKKAPENLRGFL